MRSRTLLITIMITGLFLATTISVEAFRRGKNITPYGDYCNRVSHYGMHNGMLSDRQVEEALQHYYGEKGLSYEIVRRKGRFVRAVIKKGDQIVDTVILDRRTGRIRSVY